MDLPKRYYRPETVEEALQLLAAERAHVLAGGTALVAAKSAETVVDLQAIGHDEIAVDGDTITIGALATLRAIVDDEGLPAALRELARREGPNTFRNQGTLGGVVALADWESELYALLVALDAVAAVRRHDGSRELRLAQRWQLRPDEIITSVRISAGGSVATERVGRTPADSPIVAVVGLRAPSGAVRLAVCGVADRPILVNDGDILEPPDDFRGSADYRRRMAAVLIERVRARLVA